MLLPSVALFRKLSHVFDTRQGHIYEQDDQGRPDH